MLQLIKKINAFFSNLHQGIYKRSLFPLNRLSLSPTKKLVDKLYIKQTSSWTTTSIQVPAHSIPYYKTPQKPQPPFSQSPQRDLKKASPASTEKEKQAEKVKEKDILKPEENLKALKHLRNLPRGTQVESRMLAIETLLGEAEIFQTLKTLRWPKGVLCPYCHSSNVIKKLPSVTPQDARHHYECLDCKEEDSEGGEGTGTFDDFSGLPICTLHALRQWILCWYLIGFCSLNQIAKVLGISVQEVIQIAKSGSELSQLPLADKLAAKNEMREKKRKEAAQEAESLQQEDYTRSFTKTPHKPGPKIKP